ncbi:O-acetyltransferase OatA [Sinobacterium norvegicum]|uniref:O-acetyltransferase OatA n=1 Tax=Sinobacterium norvegicum TaxID=1641715 RepID=A0ABM9AGE1_9GAMM|nr:acyltransferase [Sinobacterium norvegicum]CAH0992280.1 O-acetyltransferase OatA [Sinobacterium norvegicum]
MKRRINDIEVLRAIAIILVLIEHTQHSLVTWQAPFTERVYTYLGGWAGVDLFFAISGFVIATSLLPQLANSDGINTKLNTSISFWVRRFWRLTPSAWLWLAIILLASIIFNSSGAFHSFRANFEGAITAMLNVANLHVAFSYGRHDLGVTSPYWSLSLEEQFYFFLPLLAILTKRWLPIVLSIIIFIQLLSTRGDLFSNLLRTDALLLGVLIAMWKPSKTYPLFAPTFLEKNSAKAVFLSFLILALAVVGSESLNMIHHRISVVAIISATLVLIASYDQNYFSIIGPINKLLLWIGSRSYALYLSHVPVYAATREIWFRLEPAGTNFDHSYLLKYGLTAIILLVVCSELNYRLIETPFRKKGARIAKSIQHKSTPIPPQ